MQFTATDTCRVNTSPLSFDRLLHNTSSFGVCGLMVLGPTNFGDGDEWQVVHTHGADIYPLQEAAARLSGAMVELHHTGSMAQWYVFNEDAVVDGNPDRKWNQTFWYRDLYDLGVAGALRISIPLPLGKSFEVYLPSTVELDAADCAMVTWQVLSAWPTIGATISKRQMNRLDLTDREVECLRLGAIGFTAQAIADRLEVPVRNINFQFTSAQEKLEGRNRAHTILLAQWLGVF